MPIPVALPDLINTVPHRQCTAGELVVELVLEPARLEARAQLLQMIHCRNLQQTCTEMGTGCQGMFAGSGSVVVCLGVYRLRITVTSWFTLAQPALPPTPGIELGSLGHAAGLLTAWPNHWLQRVVEHQWRWHRRGAWAGSDQCASDDANRSFLSLFPFICRTADHRRSRDPPDLPPLPRTPDVAVPFLVHKCLGSAPPV